MSKGRVRLSCTVPLQIGEAVELLLWGGLHGNNRAEVVSRLVSNAVVQLIRDGYIKASELQEYKGLRRAHDSTEATKVTK